MNRCLGNLAAAEVEVERAVVLYESAGDEAGAASCLNNRGVLALDRAEYARADALFRQALDRSAAHGNDRFLAIVLNNLSLTTVEVGELREASVERREVAELGFLPRRARRARREIRADDRDVRKTRFEIPAFAIEFFDADAAHDGGRLRARVNGNAAIAGTLRAGRDAMEPARPKLCADDLLVVGSDLLNAEHVRALASKPREEALARRAAQTVRVEGDDSQLTI